MSHSPHERTRALAHQAACALLAALPARVQLVLLQRVLVHGEPEVCAMMMQRLRALLVASYAAGGPAAGCGAGGGAAAGCGAGGGGAAAAGAGGLQEQEGQGGAEGAAEMKEMKGRDKVVGSAELEQAVVDVAADWLVPGGRCGWGGSVADFTAGANAISTALNLLRLLALRYQHRHWLLPAPTAMPTGSGAAAGSGSDAGETSEADAKEVLRQWVRSVCGLEELKGVAQEAQEQLQAGGGKGAEQGQALPGAAGPGSLADSWLAVCRVAEVCTWLEELLM
jgi:hypothetical protein